jgi:hypothetical protein
MSEIKNAKLLLCMGNIFQIDEEIYSILSFTKKLAS